MKLVILNEIKVKGLCIRTNNANEMNSESAKIGSLWQNFFDSASPHLDKSSHIYGVYYDYESDASGEFSVLAGTDKIGGSVEDLKTIAICEGNYLVFEGKGEMPETVINTWSRIWDYFSSNEAEFERAYTTDFELYENQNAVSIYIAVKA